MPHVELMRANVGPDVQVVGDELHPLGRVKDWGAQPEELTRVERDMASLVHLLDRLDHYSLSRSRAITVPLLREGKPGWMKTLGRSIAPMPKTGDRDCGGCDGCD